MSLADHIPQEPPNYIPGKGELFHSPTMLLRNTHPNYSFQELKNKLESIQ